MKPPSSKQASPGASEQPARPAVPEETVSLTRRDLAFALLTGLFACGLAAAVVFSLKYHEKKALAPTPPEQARKLVPFDLVDRSGRRVTEQDVKGRILVVNFVFTSCSLVCRDVNYRMEEIQKLAADHPEVLLVSLTVDPRTDTPEALAKFADGFHADTNRWLLLTGEKAPLYHLIETSFIEKEPALEDLIPGGFASTDRIMLVDQKGDIRASFNGLIKGIAPSVVAEIETMLKHSDTT